jgi:hypothetical protein
MPEFAVQTLLSTPVVSIRDVRCAGDCRHKSAEECATATHLVFPYRGAAVRGLLQIRIHCDWRRDANAG